MAEKPKGGEFFYLDADGKPADADLWWPILDELERDGPSECEWLDCAARGRERGWSYEDIIALWGPPPPGVDVPGLTRPADPKPPKARRPRRRAPAR
ncbi:MAG: hypothetical protein KJ058_19040 [Thermoanaerobaculia bacterium]|nr:hypothetical protein [Thermoanaerobaculia bacterium]